MLLVRKPLRMKFVRTALVCLSTLILALCLGVSPALTRTITNTAQASWSRGEAVYAAVSNTVVLETVADAGQIEFFVASPDGAPVSYRSPQCGAEPSGIYGTPAQARLAPASSVHAGQLLYFRIVVPTGNTNPVGIDALRATLASPQGDREEVVTYETSENSSEFIGLIQTNTVQASLSGNCVLTAGPSEQISIKVTSPASSAILVAAQVEVLADPYGLIFDSENGQPVNGARVTLIDVVTGQPAQVFADDGVTPWPSTVISGQSVTDAAGRAYPFQPGEYRFPLAALGRYRLNVEPPPQFAAPSAASAEQLALLRRPDGQGFHVSSASFGSDFILESTAPLRVDVPIDPAVSPVTIAKTASRQDVLPGDALIYAITVNNANAAHPLRGLTVTDKASSLLRLKPGSIRVDGTDAGDQASFTADGRSFSVRLGELAPGASRTITYAMTVRGDAPPGTLMNEALVADDRGRTAKAGVPVRVLRDDLVSRMTVIGRITAGGCTADGVREPVSGVRVMLEDGSFAVTDADGRYHFSGLVPGTHIVQAVAATLPKGSRLIDCAQSARSAGSAHSRFVIGQGGSLAVADFAVVMSEVGATQASAPKVQPQGSEDERKAAGADKDWLAVGDGPPEFLFPAVDHNPRAPAVRVVIRHRVDQTIELKVDGKPVDPVAFDGTLQAPGGRYAVSTWRGVPLDGEKTRLSAKVRAAKGAVVTELTRDVHYSFGPAQVELIESQSRLIADGQSHLMLALRILDRKGRPVRAGSTGEFQLSAPYETAEAVDGTQQQVITGQSRRAPRWFVRGDDGMAYVELAPTMLSGKLSAHFTLMDGKTRRHSEVETWLVPGRQPWTVVGLVEATAGSKSIADAMQRSDRFDSPLGEDGRIAVYAKGPVTDGLLLTATYDSARQRDDHDMMGAIDPRAYYSVFADLSDRRFDAASRDKLYARVEGRGFSAAYGDFEAGFDQTELARYLRTATGAKGEVHRGNLRLQGFAAHIGSVHRSDEFQGAGISGPYRLSSRALVPGSETVVIEVRDRFRSDLIISSQILTRYIDYDVDLLSGTITLREPVQSRDFALNPRFIVIDYEVEQSAQQGELNGGLRGKLVLAGGRLELGGSVLSEKETAASDRTNLVALDLHAHLSNSTQVRAELGRTFVAQSSSEGWLIEAEHHSGKLDLLAYARSAQEDFGLGQQHGVETGWRKLGMDLSYHVSEGLSLDASSWRANGLSDAAQRTAVQLGAGWRGRKTDARLGLAFMQDRFSDGRTVRSTVLEGGVSQHLLDKRLELSASSSLALDGAGSIDLPARHRLSALYALTQDLRLIGTYELAKGEGIDSRSAQAGVELSPWQGARLTGGLGQQFTGEFGPRSYATFGAAQSLPLTPNLTLNATLDSNRTLFMDETRVVDPAHPVSSGGHLNGSGALSEDFTAATLGAAWHGGLWSATMRGEWRDGQHEDRKGVTLGAIRQLGEGKMLGASFNWTHAQSSGGASSRMIDSAVSLAYRPPSSDLALLAKLEYRSDRVKGAVAGEVGPTGRSALTITGDGRSERMIASVSGSWTPAGKANGQEVRRHELGFFAAVRQNLDRFQGYDLGGTTLMGGLDLRYGITSGFDLGLVGTVRANLGDKTKSYAIGPQLGFTPAKDLLLVAGYNLVGFHDPDFAAVRSTTKGPFIALRLKFDETLISRVGLGGR